MAKGTVFTREAAAAIIELVRREMRRPTRRNTLQKRQSHPDASPPMLGYLTANVSGVTDPETAAVVVNVQMVEVDSAASSPFTLKNSTTGGPADDGIQPAVYRWDSDLDDRTMVKLELFYGEWHITAAGCDPLDSAITA